MSDGGQAGKEQEEARKATVARESAETRIKVELDLDGRGSSRIQTGIGFFDHMLSALARHGFFDLTVTAQGDLYVDGHHTVEDVGICLGKALDRALGTRAGIARFGWAAVPMDDALVLAAVDLSGRPFLGVELPLSTPRVGEFETQLVVEFFRAFTWTGGFNLHLRKLSGSNDHHVIEAAFKAVGRALAMAVRVEPRLGGEVPSTKGRLGVESEPPGEVAGPTE
ncbi:MAG: imidazoleglycerol-phosphate dehydratase HisB [Limnochordales bacterium]|nr:imidazoleglycerol-phosphate dehydratase HisB [Limnochordales bacterium]